MTEQQKNTASTIQKGESILKQLVEDIKALWKAPEIFFESLNGQQKFKESIMLLGIVLLFQLLNIVVGYGLIFNKVNPYMGSYLPSLPTVLLSQLCLMALFYGSIVLIGFGMGQKQGSSNYANFKDYLAIYAYGSVPMLLSIVLLLGFEFTTVYVISIGAATLQIASSMLIGLGLCRRYGYLKIRDFMIVSASVYFAYELVDYIAGMIL